MGKSIKEHAVEFGFSECRILTKENSHEFESFIEHSDVAIEFTDGHSAPDNIKFCIDRGIPLVSGSTGWNERFNEIETLVQSSEGSFLYASNFSIGVNLFFETSRYLANLMGDKSEFAITLDETHHIHKKDKPSGTALTLASDILERVDQYDSWNIEDHEDDESILIRCHRMGEVFGIHEVNYQSKDDLIQIKHEALNRDGFSKGALLAARWLVGKKGVFSMRDVLFNN